VQAGQIVGLLGGSGSGKTTLLREILGLLRPDSGAVRLFGVDLNEPDVGCSATCAAAWACCFSMAPCFGAVGLREHCLSAAELRCLDETGFAAWFISSWPWSGWRNGGKLMPAELSGGMVKRSPWPGAGPGTRVAAAR
jgi:phospholipid/cholesterol/gamma-HCH transport system ATP-binding protein